MNNTCRPAILATLVVLLVATTGYGDDQWSDDWLATIDAAEKDDSKPILVKFEASWCGPCRQLTEALKDAEAIHLLQGMHTVRIDVDRPPDDAPVEGVSALPTMRVMTAAGDVLGEHVGFIEGNALMAWLRDGQEKYKAKRAAMRLVRSLGTGGPLNDQQTGVLLEMLADRSPRQRAAAAGLLIAHPQKVASSVIEAFEKPKLRTRIAALDVLRRWTAPIDGLDPWQPDTITDRRIAQLKEWTETFQNQKELHAKLSAEAHVEAELELDRLVRRGEVREGVIESLGLTGQELRPSVDQRLKTETTDTARERLSSVLYRLVAAPTLAIRLPEVTDSLASLDADPRRAAAKKLSEQARREDLPLLETLFGHSDPLVRELALRGLQNAGSGDTTRLAKLLEDPDKNVRAAVLKLWLDQPNSRLVKPVSQHALRETDSGLLVYYVRLLKELNSGSAESLTALRNLAGNSDWQVRAAVAEAISHRITEAADDAPMVNGVRKVPFPDDLRTAARQLLGDEDSFVISKIVPALLAGDQQESFAKLLEAAWKNENIRGEILPKLTHSTGRKNSAKFLIARFESDQPADRAFALEAMSRFRIADQEDYIRRGIEDSSTEVRLAAARSLVTWLDAKRATIAPVPPTPPNNASFGGEFGGISSQVILPEIITSDVEIEVRAQETIEIEPATPGGLLNTLGNLFGGGGNNDEAATAEAIEVYEAMLEEVPIEASETEVSPFENPFAPETEAVEQENAAESPPANDTPAGQSQPTAQEKAAAKYDGWLKQWRESPEAVIPWFAGVRPRLEELAKEGGETEMHAMMAALRLGSSLDAKRILELATQTTGAAARLGNLYPWLEPATRRKLFQLSGSSDQSATILPNLLENARRYDPKHAKGSYWQSLNRINTDALQSSWDLRRKLMLVTVGSEYLNSSDTDTLQPVAEQLAQRLTLVSAPAPRLLGLSVLGELAPQKVAELVGEDYADKSLDDTLRRDWARMAIASRGDQQAIPLAMKMLEDDVLLPVSLAFITEGHEGISSTETGSVEVSGVGDMSYSYGKLTVPKISPLVRRGKLLPLLQHQDRSVVARATYALAVMGEDVDITPLLRQAKSDGFSKYVHGMTNLLVLAIAYRNHDDEVAILEEIYGLMSVDDTYYIKEFYWKIRIMTGPRALALRKRIREDVGIKQLT